MLANSVGLALLVILETLPPAERLAFVLHDLFAMSFEEIAPIVDRSPAAARQLASRARRGDFEALLTMLDPEVTLRGIGSEVRGANAIAQRTMVLRLTFAGETIVAIEAITKGLEALDLKVL